MAYAFSYASRTLPQATLMQDSIALKYKLGKRKIMCWYIMRQMRKLQKLPDLFFAKQSSCNQKTLVEGRHWWHKDNGIFMLKSTMHLILALLQTTATIYNLVTAISISFLRNRATLSRQHSVYRGDIYTLVKMDVWSNVQNMHQCNANILNCHKMSN